MLLFIYQVAYINNSGYIGTGYKHMQNASARDLRGEKESL